jgi:hypothetical protein
MPDNLDYEQAAACLEGTFYVASGINQLKPKVGQKALVYGATGAIGSAYVQFDVSAEKFEKVLHSLNVTRLKHPAMPIFLHLQVRHHVVTVHRRAQVIRLLQSYLTYISKDSPHGAAMADERHGSDRASFC